MASASKTGRKRTSPLRSSDLKEGKTYTVHLKSGDSFTGKFAGLRNPGKGYEHVRIAPKHGMQRAIWIGTIDEITEGNK